MGQGRSKDDQKQLLVAAPVLKTPIAAAQTTERQSRRRHVKTSRQCELRLLRRRLELDISEEKREREGEGLVVSRGWRREEVEVERRNKKEQKLWKLTSWLGIQPVWVSG